MADNYNNDDGMQQQQQYCKVYDRNDFFTILVQILLAVIAGAALYYKRLMESPRRTFLTWFLDVSKQAFGACYAHVCNMIIASIISSNIRGDAVLYDQCAWYGLSYLIDTTLGLVIAIAFVKLLDYYANERDWVHLKHSGVYTGPDGWKHWISQVLAWMIILTITKLIIYLFMWTFSEPLAVIGGLLFTPLQGNIHFELVFVMILFPGFLNVIYFWIADSHLKAKKEHAGAHEGMEDKKEALIDSTTTTEQQQQKEKDYSPAPWSDASMQPPLQQATGASV